MNIKLNFFLIIIIYFLVFFNGCINFNRKASCSDIVKKDNLLCDCANLLLNVRTNNRITDVDEYLIWHKFNVQVTRKMELNIEDSCYYIAMEELLRKEKPVDSINSILELLSNQSIGSKIVFYDSVFSTLINSNTYEGHGAIPIIGKHVYLSKIDSLFTNIKSQRDFFLTYWITINKFGAVDSIEVMNRNCNEKILGTLVSFYQKLDWIPAVYLGNNVAYRFKEELFIKSAYADKN